MSTKLPDHLWPKGRSITEPDLMPAVRDSDGNTVLFTSNRRKTTESTVVDLGDSPNSNNGDPLRTAFAKVNNFIEATYWWDESINQKFRDIDSELNEGIAIFTDSDEKYSLSLLGDSKLYFKGTPNEIELNVTKQHSANNPNDWDSEINIHYQLAHTLELNNVNINEFLKIVDSDGVDRVTYKTFDYPITYNERPQNGIDAEFYIGTNVVLGRDSDDVVIVNGRVASNLIPYGDEVYNLGDSDNKWKDLYLSGNTIYLGSIQIKNNNNRGLLLLDSDGKTLNLNINEGRASTLQVDSDILVDGLTQLLGELTVSQFARFDSDVNISGNLVVGDRVTLGGFTTVNQGLTVDSDLNVTGNTVLGNNTDVLGNFYVKQNAVFDSDVSIAGAVSASSFKSNSTGPMTFSDPVLFEHHVTMDSDVDISGNLTVNQNVSLLGDVFIRQNASFDSDVQIDGRLTVSQEVTFEDDVFFRDNAQFDSDINVLGNATVNGNTNLQGDLVVKQNARFDSDVNITGQLTVDSDVSITGQLTVSKETTFEDDVVFNDHVQFDSDIEVIGNVTIRKELTVDQNVSLLGDVFIRQNASFDSDVLIDGRLTVSQETTFEDDVLFLDNALFDSDVLIRGSLTVNGSATFVSPNNLQVSDNLIVLNYGQPSPFNDTGIIFSRYDSDSVSAVNWNVKLMWDETSDQFVFGQTSGSGLLPNPDTTQKYLEVGDAVEFFDSENVARMVWNKQQARLSILNKDGSEAFAFDADSGQMEGNGTIDAGFY